MNELVDPLVWYVAFLFSVTLHEAAHAWAAKRGGDLTAYFGGQVSLDPVPHIRREPFGMVLLPILSLALFGWPFGYASTPYDPMWARAHPRRAAWMSLAGPGANLLLVLLAALCIRFGIAGDAFAAPPSVNVSHVVEATASTGLAATCAFVLSVFFSLNLILLLFNLLPVPPLDGSGALPLLLPESAAERYQEWMSQPMVGIIGILIAWNVFAPIFQRVFLVAVNWLHPGAHYA
ncbi:MAG: site-2 protease family protein [Myxococcota bacterium]|nr:site-2 protease family protein [Myxococcota bacterium]